MNDLQRIEIKKITKLVEHNNKILKKIESSEKIFSINTLAHIILPAVLGSLVGVGCNLLGIDIPPIKSLNTISNNQTYNSEDLLIAIPVATTISSALTLTLLGLPENKDKRIKSWGLAVVSGMIFPTTAGILINLQTQKHINDLQSEVNRELEEVVSELTEKLTDPNILPRPQFNLALTNLESIVELDCIKTASSTLNSIQENLKKYQAILNSNNPEQLQNSSIGIDGDVTEQRENQLQTIQDIEEIEERLKMIQEKIDGKKQNEDSSPSDERCLISSTNASD